ncbi:MAG TPA: ABC transporter permease [Opitutus sp.]|nr:ABC transporter permease [Opitutus sp.]
MSVTRESQDAQATSELDGDVLVAALSGQWRITERRPSWESVRGERQPKRVRVVVDRVERWDSSLLLFVFEAQQWCRATGVHFELEALPERIRNLLLQLSASHETSVPFDRSQSFLAMVGQATMGLSRKFSGMFQFVGECVIGATRLLKNPRKFRWRDCADEMLHCGAMALPIVSLISFLVGVTLAYTGALVLRQYGGDIYVADLIGMAVCREMGAVMTGVVLAGRTGAAFAATLGNMKANEEIDALETLGISAVDFLVLPRLIALGVMMPLLTLYANALGILGGMAVSMGVLNIPPAAYWVEMGTIVGLSDVAVGVIKAISFGLIIGLSGCLRGLQAERSAAGVGRAATSAVVTSILLIVVSDAVFAVLFNVIGW